MATLKHTPLNQWHQDHKAQLAPFAGYQLPMHYGSALDEHRAVRATVGIFDISHMQAIRLQGAAATKALMRALANDIEKCSEPGKAIYTCMLNHSGGIIDDLICYRTAPDDYRMVVNAACFDKDLRWLRTHFPELTIETFPDHAIVAVQGPAALAALAKHFPQFSQGADMGPMHGKQIESGFIARSGYTGEDGVEIICERTIAIALFDALYKSGARPCGLAARDSLRLEAGLNLYGMDMDDTTLPSECGLSWTVDTKRDRDFIGREALIDADPATLRAQVGVRLGKQTIPRHGTRVIEGGVITSGGYSPSLDCAIGFAMVPQALKDRETLNLEIRGKAVPAKICSTRFYQRNKKL